MKTRVSRWGNSLAIRLPKADAPRAVVTEVQAQLAALLGIAG